jgi:hypothetical protein
MGISNQQETISRQQKLSLRKSAIPFCLAMKEPEVS